MFHWIRLSKSEMPLSVPVSMNYKTIYLMRNPRLTKTRTFVADILTLLDGRLVRFRVPKLTVRSGTSVAVSARLSVRRGLLSSGRGHMGWFVLVSYSGAKFQFHLGLPVNDILRIILKSCKKTQSNSTLHDRWQRPLKSIPLPTPPPSHIQKERKKI